MKNTQKIQPTPARQFHVHVGYSSSGRDRWRHFATMGDASAFCDRFFRITGIVLTIGFRHEATSR